MGSRSTIESGDNMTADTLPFIVTTIDQFVQPIKIKLHYTFCCEAGIALGDSHRLVRIERDAQ
jgi:hypothetical protein